MTRLRRWAGAAQELLLTVVACLGAVALLAATLCLTFDLRVLAFESGSMSPAISTGSLAVARSVPAADLDRGDIVSVPTASGSRVTHRIVGIEQADGQAVLRLQGDGNRVPDAASYPVKDADRVLFSVPLLGYAGSALTSPAGLVALGLLATLLVVVLIRESARPRHRGTRSRAVLLTGLALALGISGPSVLAGRTGSTLAAWTDPVTASTRAFSAGTIQQPVVTCVSVKDGIMIIDWDVVPGATGYVVHRGSGGTTVSTTPTSLHFSPTPPGTSVVWIVAYRYINATNTWYSVASESFTYSAADMGTPCS